MTLFPAPTGLAVGLALKELRYAVLCGKAGDSPQNRLYAGSPWVPRVQPPQTKKAGLRLVDGRHATSVSGRHLAKKAAKCGLVLSGPPRPRRTPRRARRPCPGRGPR